MIFPLRRPGGGVGQPSLEGWGRPPRDRRLHPRCACAQIRRAISAVIRKAPCGGCRSSVLDARYRLIQRNTSLRYPSKAFGSASSTPKRAPSEHSRTQPLRAPAGPRGHGPSPMAIAHYTTSRASSRERHLIGARSAFGHRGCSHCAFSHSALADAALRCVSTPIACDRAAQARGPRWREGKAMLRRLPPAFRSLPASWGLGPLPRLGPSEHAGRAAADGAGARRRSTNWWHGRASSELIRKRRNNPCLQEAAPKG
jgi:hypothetical protein